MLLREQSGKRRSNEKQKFEAKEIGTSVFLQNGVNGGKRVV